MLTPSARFDGAPTASDEQSLQRAGTEVGVPGSANFSNNPTITDVPLTGAKFLRSLIESVPPLTVLYLLQVGHPADFVIELDSADHLSVVLDIHSERKISFARSAFGAAPALCVRLAQSYP